MKVRIDIGHTRDGFDDGERVGDKNWVGSEGVRLGQERERDREEEEILDLQGRKSGDE